jgi:hypothetical protein
VVCRADLGRGLLAAVEARPVLLVCVPD